MSSLSKDRILDLPIEVLESIADLCDPATDILALRLSCRTLAAAAFRTFTTEYISKLYCFMLDPKRLQRVIKILDQPHLAARVTVVQFTLLAHERRMTRPVPVAEHGYSEQRKMQDAYAEEEYDRLECPTHSISDECWSRVRHIMTHMAQQTRKWVAIDTHAEESVHSRIATKHPDLPFRLLDMALASGCKVKRHILSSAFDVDGAEFMPSQRFHSVLQKLQQFAYVCRSFRVDDLDNPKISNQCDLVKIIEEGAPNLRDLRLVVNHQAWPLREDCMTLCARLLSGPAFPSLRTVLLKSMQFQQVELLGFLKRCPPELENFWTCGVAVSHPADPLTEILEALTHFPKLREVRFDTISVHSERFIRKSPRFIVPETGINERVVDPSFNNVDGKRFLEVNLREGIEYTEYSSD